MTTKQVTKKKAALAKHDKQSESDQAKSERYAGISLSASYMNAILGDSFTNPILPEAKIANVASALKDKIETVQAGDMTSIEAMLIGQAHALQTMFVSLGRQAASKTQLVQYTAFMNLALKAQAQSRATIQALTELKYPKQATFVKQANIAGGNQQVNNGNNASSTHAPAHARVIENQPNELLNEMNHATLDNNGTATTSSANKAMATVAT